MPPFFSRQLNNQQEWLLFFWVQDAQRTESTLDSSGVWRLFFVLELNGLVEIARYNPGQLKIWRNVPTDDDLQPLAPFFVYCYSPLLRQISKKLTYYCLIEQLERRPSILH